MPMYVCVCVRTHVRAHAHVWVCRGVKVMKLKGHHNMKGSTEILRNWGWMKLTNYM